MNEAGNAVGGPLGSRWNAAGKLLGNEAPEMLLESLLAVCGGTELSHRLLEKVLCNCRLVAVAMRCARPAQANCEMLCIPSKTYIRAAAGGTYR